jgi:lantibiotic biosynthesis protein
MTVPYTYHPQLVMRTPQKAFTNAIGKGDEFLQSLIEDNNFLEALFLASPVLHTELLKYQQGKITDEKTLKKLLFSLTKYHLRMSSRCTPFGLFSGCSVVHWSDDKNSITIDNQKLDRHTRFDMHYLCALAQHLAMLPAIKNKLQYFANTAFYTVTEEIRYVEYNYQNGHRKHIISSILASEYALDILQAAQSGISITAMVNLLVSDEITAEEATDFINEMIAAQVLVNELEPAVTGSEFLYQMIDTLQKINVAGDIDINEIIATLEHIEKLMQHIDAHTVNDAAAYQEIIDCIKKFNIPFEENKLFQTDLNFILKADKINTTYQTAITEALSAVNLLNKQQENPNLVSFAKRFYERYEDNEMPLLEVLDNETGIGYLSNGSGNITPLLNDIVIGGAATAENQLPWGMRDKFLLNKLLKATAQNDYSIELEPKELDNFKNDWNLLPPSISVMFRLLGDDKILLESSGSSSAINLLGRFAHGNKAIHQIIDEVVQEEDEKNPSVIFAEIVHLPESRIGNILLHPAFRKYEIPFLSKSAVESQNQIALQDLYISVKGNTVLLRSKKLNKIVVPRLSSAHNYSHGALPIYQFLADMQLQGKQGGIYFNWGALENQYKFLPRVTYKNIVVDTAQWNFAKEDIAALTGKTDEALMNAIADFKLLWKLPELIVLADSDNELLINLDDKLMVEVWLDAVKKRNGFIIKEFLGGNKNTPVKDNSGNVYTNQFIAVLLRNTPAYNMPVLAPDNDIQTGVQQNFTIGSQWIYYKMYCGYKTADTILQSLIQPLVKTLLEEKAIDSFFFIRYSDPNFHLRIRFHITDISKLGYVLSLVQQQIQPFLQERLIWNIQNDTYKRELNRYGYQTIEQAENLFYHDSIAVLQFLALTEGDSREQLRWQWAIRAIDEWLNAFEYTIEQKFTILEQVKNSFHTEFKADKFLKEQLSNKYRVQKVAIEGIMEYNMDETNELYPLIKILKEKSAAIKPIVHQLKQMYEKQQLVPAINELMPSYIHMLVNRIVTSSPRQHELVIYDILFSYYRSAIAREKKKVTQVPVPEKIQSNKVAEMV